MLAVLAVTLSPSVGAWSANKYKVLHAFGKGNDGGGLWTSVTLDKKGSLYGATSGGGSYSYGTIFRLTPHADSSWTETILHSFKNGDPNGSEPNGGLVHDLAGNWYGTTNRDGAHHGGTALELRHGPRGWKVSVIYAFGEQNNDGGSPTAGLVMDDAGNLFGTTPNGNGSNGGTIFQLSPGSGGWHETVIYQFCHSNPKCVDGAAPQAGVILDSAGNLYGTTEGGGAYGLGTVYEVKHTSSGWKEQVMHSFDNNGKDGVTPGWGALVIDAKGSLYGTTATGGCCGGVIFKLTPQTDGRWKETILYDFKGGASGFEAGAGVVMDKAGNLYGTTIAGGSGCGCGVVYKLSPGANDKWTYTVLHTFTGSDGAQPDANLILDSKGNLYGTTANGGGVVFELTP